MVNPTIEMNESNTLDTNLAIKCGSNKTGVE